MKHNILLLTFLAFAGLVRAQDLTFSVSPVSVQGIPATQDEAIGHSTITNTATTTRSLTWKRTIIDIADNWMVAVCDKNQCYAPNTSTRNLNMTAGEEGTMDVHAYPFGTEGYAIVEIKVFDQADTTQAVTNLYYFNTLPSSTSEPTVQSFKVYPNPTNGMFTIKGDKLVDAVQVFSLTGRMVRSFRYNDGQWYNVGDLPKGTYLVRLIDRSGQQLVTKLINKL
ncbi:MAG: T9SS type A sorting domain-containing protein [Saprospiraceae bacterium]